MPTPAPTPTEDGRPSPDALLRAARQEGRGHLKIFLGAAPGVGKTYAMLSAAHELLRQGVDVLAGVIEHHGREETRALLQGMPQQPLMTLDYRGRPFQDMDLDGILARSPRLVLVDEFAHSNVPGCRHARRWQDVAELLEAGIDVYTTLNIQHLESLNDIVQRIAGIKVRETVPDTVFAAADEIELIDLPPPDLIRRLEDGKVYVPEQARRAIHHFFSPATLTALREMALRQAAERVDRQMVDYMRAHAITGPWPTRERVLVYLDPDCDGERLVRSGKRMAERRGASWGAVVVETPHAAVLDEARRDRLAAALRLTSRLGGDSTTIHGDDAVEALLGHARSSNATVLVVGRQPRRWWRRTMADHLLARSGEVNLLVVAEQARSKDEVQATSPAGVGWSWRAAVVASLAVVGATLVGHGIDLLGLPLPNISVAYLMGVLFVAIRAGQLPAIAASVASFFAFNFFFTEPRYTFAITDTQNILTVVFFLLAAVVVSRMAARLRVQVQVLRENARRTETLYAFGRKVSAAVTQDDVLWAIAHHVASTVHGSSVILLPAEGGLQVAAAYPPEDNLDDRSAAAAEWAWSHEQVAGRGTSTLPAAQWLFMPLKTARGAVGVLGVHVASPQAPLPDTMRLVETLADQAAIALERTTLVQDIEAARVATERERLRSALLSSLSHDLRTPLVSIMGASSSLLSYGDRLDNGSRTELAQTIQDEAERLNRFVQNLLDMTRLGAGALVPKRDWVDVQDLLRSVVGRAARLTRQHVVQVEITPQMPLLYVDGVLMEQVVFNLLDNACKYAPAGTVVKLWASHTAGQAVIEVVDQGPGIPLADRERVFDMFYRVDQGDHRSGTGLGLAICRGIVQAHGGTIVADGGLHGVGTGVIIRLPLSAPPAEAPP